MTLTQAIRKQFDKYPGKSIVLPALVAMTMLELGVTPEEYAAKVKKAQSKIRSLSRKGELVITSGYRGGVKRASDMTEGDIKLRAINQAIKHLKAEKRKLLNG